MSIGEWIAMGSLALTFVGMTVALIYSCGVFRQEVRSINERLDDGNERMTRLEQRIDTILMR